MDEYGIRKDPNYRLLDSEDLAEGDVVRLSRERFRLPNGVETEQDILRIQDAVAIVPMTEEGEVVLIEQFRPSVQGYMHEIPAGRPENGESWEDAARRELEEETGFRASMWSHIVSLLMIPGTSSHRLHFFLAEDLEVGEFAPEDVECIRVRRVPLAPLVRRLIHDPPGSTPIVDAKTHVALLHVSQLLESRKERGAC